MNRRLLLLSSSRVHGFQYLEHAAKTITEFLEKSDVSKVTFIPYALKNHDEYTDLVKEAFKRLHLKFQVEGIHEANDPVQELQQAQAIFIGGGNTFLLLKTLYEKKLVDVIRKRVLQDGVPYMGSSAGTNVATVSIHTTNDMPIVYPPSFDALNLVPFNINPHYIDPEPDSKHKGETREERIKQYHETSNSHPVLGLKEGSYLWVEGNKVTLLGLESAKLFQQNKDVAELPVNSDLTFLLH